MQQTRLLAPPGHFPNQYIPPSSLSILYHHPLFYTIFYPLLSTIPCSPLSLYYTTSVLHYTRPSTLYSLIYHPPLFTIRLFDISSDFPTLPPAEQYHFSTSQPTHLYQTISVLHLKSSSKKYFSTSVQKLTFLSVSQKISAKKWNDEKSLGRRK